MTMSYTFKAAIYLATTVIGTLLPENNTNSCFVSSCVHCLVCFDSLKLTCRVLSPMSWSSFNRSAFCVVLHIMSFLVLIIIIITLSCGLYLILHCLEYHVFSLAFTVSSCSLVGHVFYCLHCIVSYVMSSPVLVLAYIMVLIVLHGSFIAKYR